MSVPFEELDDKTRKRLGLNKGGGSRFTMEMRRRHAIRVLAVIADLSQNDRRLVLEHALKVNAT